MPGGGAEGGGPLGDGVDGGGEYDRCTGAVATAGSTGGSGSLTVAV
jgi:hypothetical protein